MLVPTAMFSSPERLDAIHMPVALFLPTDADFQLLKERMLIMIKRVISSYVRMFEGERETAHEHIRHDKWDESTKKSELVRF